MKGHGNKISYKTTPNIWFTLWAILKNVTLQVKQLGKPPFRAIFTEILAISNSNIWPHCLLPGHLLASRSGSRGAHHLADQDLHGHHFSACLPHLQNPRPDSRRRNWHRLRQEEAHRVASGDEVKLLKVIGTNS